MESLNLLIKVQTTTIILIHPKTKLVSCTEAGTSDGIRRLFWFGGQRSAAIAKHAQQLSKEAKTAPLTSR